MEPKLTSRRRREATVVAPWTFSDIALTLTHLKRHTIAPRGSRIHYENVPQGAEVASGTYRVLRGATVVAP